MTKKPKQDVKAKEKFEHIMTALFRIPKSIVADKIKAEKKKGKA